MNVWQIAILVMFGSWLFVFALIGFADSLARRRVDAMLEMRDWEETMRAMHRMYEEEGDE
jgi:4-amino-4-deoxy-L-arabinose transferase-like glycosyltransferase